VGSRERRKAICSLQLCAIYYVDFAVHLCGLLDSPR
jgi:hypothetical protein